MTEFRRYSQASEDPIAEFYRLNHENQTLDFARAKRAEYGALSHGEMGVWEACERLDELVDDSDPDTDLSQLGHLLQTAEAARADDRPDWFILAGLVHDLGKVLCLWGEPQWAVVGDTFPLGCAFSEDVVYFEYFDGNPDVKVKTYQTETGIYRPHCGLSDVTMSWGHDEYMYLVARKYLPMEALYIIRYHSFYAAHDKGAYEYLMDRRDKALMKEVKEFNQYDLYSKADDPPDVDALRPYYRALISRYFPAKIAW